MPNLRGVFQTGPEAGITDIGGFATLMINDTGSPSVKGELGDASTVIDNGFTLEVANGIDPICVVYEDGIADGALCWVVTGGKCDILLTDTLGSTHGNWVGVSTTVSGRADADVGSPANQTRHFQEIGHSLQTIAGGTDVLCRIILHFN